MSAAEPPRLADAVELAAGELEAAGARLAEADEQTSQGHRYDAAWNMTRAQAGALVGIGVLLAGMAGDQLARKLTRGAVGQADDDQAPVVACVHCGARSEHWRPAHRDET